MSFSAKGNVIPYGATDNLGSGLRAVLESEIRKMRCKLLWKTTGERLTSSGPSWFQLRVHKRGGSETSDHVRFCLLRLPQLRPATACPRLSVCEWRCGPRVLENAGVKSARSSPGQVSPGPVSHVTLPPVVSKAPTLRLVSTAYGRSWNSKHTPFLGILLFMIGSIPLEKMLFFFAWGKKLISW